MINEILAQVQAHPGWSLAIWTAITNGGQYLFNCVVDSMPTPQPMGSPWYTFAYKLAHRIAGNNSEAKKQF